MVASHGSVSRLQVSEVRREPMRSLDQVQLRAGYGIEGDRRAGRAGASTDRQVLIMDSETQRELDIGPAVTRENVTTVGLDISVLRTGQRVRLGDSAVVEITGDCAPCSFMDEARPGLREQIDGRRGVLGRVVADGLVRQGDTVALEQ